MGILIVLIGGLLFIYFNIKCLIKINFALSFLHIYFSIIFLRKKYVYERNVNYYATQKVISRYRSPDARYRFKKYIKYYKHVKKAFNLFYIKNILIYPECISEKQSFAVEFAIVNRILKKSLLNG
jgi:hypothetical protein